MIVLFSSNYRFFRFILTNYSRLKNKHIMKRLISLFLLTLGIILPILAQQKEIDVYLVGGQSNATGQAYVKNIPASFKIDTRVRIYYSRFLNKGEGSEQWNPLCQASETKINSE